MEVGDHCGNVQEIINLTENLDCYYVYPDIHDHDDLGRYYIEELDAMQVPEHLRNYIDYEAYGWDIALDENGEFTSFGYVWGSGSSFVEFYDGDRENIPEEYRVMAFQEEPAQENTFSIYQLKGGDQTLDYRFEPLDAIHRNGLSVKPENYELVYQAPLVAGMSLENIYTQFNMNRPADFYGHSLSVSDIVVLHEDGKDTAHYCDLLDFPQVRSF